MHVLEVWGGCQTANGQRWSRHVDLPVRAERHSHAHRGLCVCKGGGVRRLCCTFGVITMQVHELFVLNRADGCMAIGEEGDAVIDGGTRGVTT